MQRWTQAHSSPARRNGRSSRRLSLGSLPLLARRRKSLNDAILPDRDTGLPRQRDVWIEWKLFGHYPCKALVSCTYWSQPLDQQDIDHFRGEFLGTEANVGIIYSREGFNDNAIAKAKALGFHCCRLYRDQPPEIPEHLFLTFYLFNPSCQLFMTGEAGDRQLVNWKDALALPCGTTTVLVGLAVKYTQFQKMVSLKDSWRKAREGEAYHAEVTDGGPPLFVGLRMNYKVYRAKSEYTLLDGSYNCTAGDFQGSQKSPVIDMHNFSPDPSWELVLELPAGLPVNYAAIIGGNSSVKELQRAGEQPLPPPTKGEARIRESD
jgi:hypothetical protein